jgi:hypothetical protein
VENCSGSRRSEDFCRRVIVLRVLAPQR